MIEMLFAINFRSFTGGHLKNSHFLSHIAGSGLVQPLLYLPPDTLDRADNPYLDLGVPILSRLRPCDCYYMTALDWNLLDAAGIDTAGKPVLNTIQGMRHADPADPRYRFLSRPALRICVSSDVAEAIRATGQVNGDILTIANCLDMQALADLRIPAKPRRLFIAGLKNQNLAQELAARLKYEWDVDMVPHQISRVEFLSRMAPAEIAVLLPAVSEGFFLPALEAMALGVAAIVPDAIGNRSFCHDGQNCLVPDYNLDGLLRAVAMLEQDPQLAVRIRMAGMATASHHALETERESFVRAFSRYLADNDPAKSACRSF